MIAQWEYALCNFRPDAIYVVGPEMPRSQFLERAGAELISDATAVSGEFEIVLLAPINGANLRGSVSLASFEHPAHALYWFGSDSRHIEACLFAGRAPDHSVFIPTDTRDQMYSFAAWCVTAWDRRSKG